MIPHCCEIITKMNTCILFLVFFIYFVDCRNFYVGMFKKNDILVAQDRLYKEKTPYRFTYAKYGRLFKCPITYLRVVDRLGVGRGPRVQIIRGGLQKKYIVLRLTSPYDLPISVNIYVGCENKMTSDYGPQTDATTVLTVPTDIATTDNGNKTDNGETTAAAAPTTAAG